MRLIDLPIEPAVHDAPFWGAVDPERHAALSRRGIHLHVYVAGEDVTLRCRFFDDRPGRTRADLYVLSPDGLHIMRAAPDSIRPAIERCRRFLIVDGDPIVGAQP
jgi:hypothetical protein